jgi:secondary thiamine-phosphate synthase enzyme
LATCGAAGAYAASILKVVRFCSVRRSSLAGVELRVMGTHGITVRSREREELVEFTGEVRRILRETGAREGVCVLYVRHTTAGLTINENADPDVPRDMLHALRTLIPQHGMGFRHGEENSDAHIKTTLVGTSVTVPFADGELLLGRWQGIFLCEFDGGREREVILQVLRAEN